MSVFNQAISDSYLWAAVVFRVFLFVILSNPLSDGYHVVNRDSILEWEETYIIAVLIPEVYILSWVTALIIQSGQAIVPFLQVDLWTVVLGIIGARMVVPWFITLKDTDTTTLDSIAELSRMSVSALFGIGFGVTLVIVTQPNVETLQLVYRRHINFAVNILQQFQVILGLSIPQLQFLDPLQSIYINNAQLAVKAGLLGAAGSLLSGLAIPIIIMGVNAVVIFGVFTGLLIRIQSP